MVDGGGFFLLFSWEQIIIQTRVRCQESDVRPWYVFLDDAQGHPGAGRRHGAGAAASAGAGLGHQHGPLRYTAPLSGAGA